jgi:flagellar P-ring protein precursor FlgI
MNLGELGDGFIFFVFSKKEGMMRRILPGTDFIMAALVLWQVICICTCICTCTCICDCQANAAGVPSRIKDLVHIQGVRENQLIGYGLIVGLKGTGDKGSTRFTITSLSNMLKKLGVSVDPADLKVKNVAAVIVTASLPPFARKGERIDVTVSSLGDATSLQ